jgi:hypothetical protein
MTRHSRSQFNKRTSKRSCKPHQYKHQIHADGLLRDWLEKFNHWAGMHTINFIKNSRNLVKEAEKARLEKIRRNYPPGWHDL